MNRAEQNEIGLKMHKHSIAAALFVVLSGPAVAQEVITGGDYLAAHNDYRAKHCVPALKRSEALEKAAIEYAKKLASGAASGHDNTPDGENIYASGSSTGADANANVSGAASWYSEIKDFDFEKGAKKEGGSAVGHFTQMIWKATTEVGCGVATAKSDDMTMTHVVCRYRPMGNDASNDGALYKVNVPKACK